MIESIVIGYPVPEIVLAESQEKRRSFIVIDGKQRLLTIAGFISPDDFEYWNRPTLKNLNIRHDLNSKSYDDLSQDPDLADDYREFMNSSLRCTVITNFRSNDVLYDIFYRVNSGSVPLSTQELRQVLNRGEFANYLIDITNDFQPIHKVLNLSGPDKRLRDIEIILRLIAFIKYGDSYTGNLKKFLDEAMATITNNWGQIEGEIIACYDRINQSIERLAALFGNVKKAGRKIRGGEFERRFNRVLFEVEIFYMYHLNDNINVSQYTELFEDSFVNLFEENPDFRASIEATTKSVESYHIRYTHFQTLMNTVFNVNMTVNPF